MSDRTSPVPCTAWLALAAALLIPGFAQAQTGGPDASGTIFAPAIFDWVPLASEPGATLHALTDDSQTLVDVATATGWAGVNWYGTVYPSMVIDSNGKMNFDPLALWDRFNACLPATTTGAGDQPDIGLFWDDLNPGAGGGVYSWYDATVDRFIVSYEDVPHFSGTDPISVQAHIYETGEVEFHWLDTFAANPLEDNGAEATIGIQDYTGGTHTTGNSLEWSCNTPSVVDGTATAFLVCVDGDLDGFPDVACGGNDCDDTDPAINPDAPEICDAGIDNDCDATTDENVDGDADTVTICAGDCDDDDATAYPGNTETCDGIDNNCDTVVDEGFDADMDGVAPCTGDCDDTNPLIYPGAPELCNGLDDNCDGAAVFGGTAEPTSPTTSQGTGGGRYRGNIYAPTVDSNIDRVGWTLDTPVGTVITYRVYESSSQSGPWNEVASATLTTSLTGQVVHESPTMNVSMQSGMFYAVGAHWDLASLGYYWASGLFPFTQSFGAAVQGITGTTLPTGTGVSVGTTSNIYPITIFSGTQEIDADMDTYLACEDCDDNDPTVIPTAAEICNGVDDDCDGVLFVDGNGNDESDADGDGEYACADDCDDTNPDTYLGAPEACDGLDNDCDTVVPADESTDVDMDTYLACEDCNDNDNTIFPGAVELCDGIDGNCDGSLIIGFDEPPLPTLSGSSSSLLRGSRWTPSNTIELGYIHAFLGVTAGTTLTWKLWEGTSPTGPWTQVWTMDTTVNTTAGQSIYHDSPYVGWQMQAGTTYATTVEWTGAPASVQYNWMNGATLPGTASFGTYDGGMAGSAGTTSPSTSTSAYTIGVSTGLEGDADNDTYLGCLDDCNDQDPNVNPVAAEVCDGEDNNCDGTFFVDGNGNDELDIDQDGGLACDGDCDDTDPTVLSGGPELCDGLDNDCDGTVPADESTDVDLDTYVLCDDCNDGDNTVFPGAAELCDGIDQNCDGNLGAGTDETITPTIFSSSSSLLRGARYEVTSGTFLESFDAFLDPAVGTALTWKIWESATDASGSYTEIAALNSTVVTPQLPGGEEQWIPSPIFNQSLTAGMFYTVTVQWTGASPSVGYAYASSSAVTYPVPVSFGNYVGAATGSGTATSFSSSTTPYTFRVHTGLDEDDGDSDTFLGCLDDCDDDNSAVNPSATEVCDGVDNNCDSTLFTGEDDFDEDTYLACDNDCDDTNPDVYTGAPEICDALDNDCDTVIPPNESTDVDNDGSVTCADCDDNDPTAYPGNVEICDGIDNDCNGLVGGGGAEPAPTWTSTGTGGARYRGNRYEATSAALIATVGYEHDAPVGTIMTFSVYEGATDTGPWNELATASMTTTLTGTAVHESPPLNAQVQAGMFYAVGVHWDLSGSYYWGSGQFPLAQSFGNAIAGLLGSGALPTGSGVSLGTSTNAYPVTIYTGVPETDIDMDTFLSCAGDCDDNNPAVNPNATEVCGDGNDNDCDGINTTGLDADSDSFTDCNGDCDETDGTIYPGATELCDELDNDCDGVIPVIETDTDTDGYIGCEECDDTDPAINPAATEVCDGVDTNCDGVLPPDEADADNDGLAECLGDCNDNEPTIPSTSELCDGLDSDCNGTIPAAEADNDLDGVLLCGGDCDDNDAANYPGNTEICDGQDNDCNGSADFDGSGEVDGDGDGSPGCIDCDDADILNFPGNPEVCDGQDNDCDVSTDETVDFDTDGFTVCDGDCNDAEITAYPGADEICDGGIDNDCDPTTDEDGDVDGDGETICDGDCDDDNADTNSTATEICDGEDNDCDGTIPSPDEDDIDGDGSPACEDCDDADANNFPGNTELCDGLDNDCDGAAETNNVDDDLDGQTVCDGDCDDTNPDIYLGAPELCDALDNDCNLELPADELDDDLDGFLICEGDCDDAQAGVNPDALEADFCDDGVDNDCDGDIDDEDADCDVGDDDDSADDDDDSADDDDDSASDDDDDDDDSAGDDDDDDDSTGGTGCENCNNSVAGGGSPVGLAALLTLLGAGLARRRREA